MTSVTNPQNRFNRHDSEQFAKLRSACFSRLYKRSKLLPIELKMHLADLEQEANVRILEMHGELCSHVVTRVSWDLYDYVLRNVYQLERHSGGQYGATRPAFDLDDETETGHSPYEWQADPESSLRQIEDDLIWQESRPEAAAFWREAHTAIYEVLSALRDPVFIKGSNLRRKHEAAYLFIQMMRNGWSMEETASYHNESVSTLKRARQLIRQWLTLSIDEQAARLLRFYNTISPLADIPKMVRLETPRKFSHNGELYCCHKKKGYVMLQLHHKGKNYARTLGDEGGWVQREHVLGVLKKLHEAANAPDPVLPAFGD